MIHIESYSSELQNVVQLLQCAKYSVKMCLNIMTLIGGIVYIHYGSEKGTFMKFKFRMILISFCCCESFANQFIE